MNKFMSAVLIVLSTVSTAYSQTVVDTTTRSTSEVETEGRTVVISPPPSAISPSVGSSTSDLCMAGVSGAVQTQILGVSTGEMVRDENCERLKISKTLYDMGMKVAQCQFFVRIVEYMMQWKWQEHLVRFLERLVIRQLMSGKQIHTEYQL